MDLDGLVALVPDFEVLKPREKIRLFAWFLHTQKKIDVFDNAAMRDCFKAINAVDPNVARELPRMAEAKPPDLIRSRGGYKLEGAIRRTLDTRYGSGATTIAVNRLLDALPSAVPDLTERAFLDEAIDCYRVRAFRASIVMTWNLAFDHLLQWIVSNPNRLTAFNSSIAVRYPKKADFVITKRDDFDDLKESETIEICRSANIISKNLTEILRDHLKRRNISAHPSTVVVTQSQADHAITDLITNVVMPLS